MNETAPRILVRLERKIDTRVRRLAKEGRRSINAQINLLLEKALKEEK